MEETKSNIICRLHKINKNIRFFIYLNRDNLECVRVIISTYSI